MGHVSPEKMWILKLCTDWVVLAFKIKARLGHKPRLKAAFWFLGLHDAADPGPPLVRAPPVPDQHSLVPVIAVPG